MRMIYESINPNQKIYIIDTINFTDTIKETGDPICEIGESHFLDPERATVLMEQYAERGCFEEYPIAFYATSEKTGETVLVLVSGRHKIIAIRNLDGTEMGINIIPMPERMELYEKIRALNDQRPILASERGEIYSLRIEYGDSVKEIAKACGVKRSTVQKDIDAYEGVKSDHSKYSSEQKEHLPISPYVKLVRSGYIPKDIESIRDVAVEKNVIVNNAVINEIKAKKAEKRKQGMSVSGGEALREVLKDRGSSKNFYRIEPRTSKHLEIVELFKAMANVKDGNVEQVMWMAHEKWYEEFGDKEKEILKGEYFV